MSPRKKRNAQAQEARKQLAKINPSNSHPQQQSPLFFKLPPEIRNQIFDLALSPYGDTDGFHTYRFLLRPDLLYTPKIWPQLTQTCRLVYYETSSLPIRNYTFYITRGIHFLWSKLTCRQASQFTAKNGQDLYHVRFTQFHPSQMHRFLAIPAFRPKVLTIYVPLFERSVEEQHAWITTSLTTGDGSIPTCKPSWEPKGGDRPISSLPAYLGERWPQSLTELRVELGVETRHRAALHDWLARLPRRQRSCFFPGHEGVVLQCARPARWETRHTTAPMFPVGGLSTEVEWMEVCTTTVVYQVHRTGVEGRRLGAGEAADSDMDGMGEAEHETDGIEVESAPRRVEARQDCAMERWLAAWETSLFKDKFIEGKPRDGNYRLMSNVNCGVPRR